MQKGRASLLRGGRAGYPSPAVLTLGLAALAPPACAVAMPGGLALLSAPRTGIILATALAVGPVVTGLAYGLRRLGGVRGMPPDGEQGHAVTRVALAAAMLAYALGLGLLVAPEEASTRCAVVAALGVVCAWLFLLLAILTPAPSALRRLVAVAADVGLLSAFLHAGDFLTAAWYPAYFYLAIRGSAGPPRESGLTVLAVIAGFAAIAATTRFWFYQPLLSLGSGAALALVPAYVAALVRKLSRSAAAAEAAREADARLFAGLGDGLRKSLKAVLRAGAKLDRTDLTSEEGEMIARMRLSARAALVQIDEIPTYAKIGAGNFAPETRSFDLYQLVHGAVAALRPQAADRGIALTVRIDPRLPYELRGWPHQLRQTADLSRRRGDARLGACLDPGASRPCRVGRRHGAAAAGGASPGRAAHAGPGAGRASGARPGACGGRPARRRDGRRDGRAPRRARGSAQAGRHRGRAAVCDRPRDGGFAARSRRAAGADRHRGWRLRRRTQRGADFVARRCRAGSARASRRLAYVETIAARAAAAGPDRRRPRRRARGAELGAPRDPSQPRRARLTCCLSPPRRASTA